MSFLFSMAGRLARLALVAPAIERMKRRAIRNAIGAGLVIVFGTLGVAYLLIALRVELEYYIGPLWAPVAIGGTLCLIAGISYLVYLRPRRPRRQPAQAPSIGIPPELSASVRGLETQVANRPLQSVAVALAVGFAAAYAMRLLRKDRAPAAAPPPSSPWPRAPDPLREAERQAWMREGMLREADRRRANGKGA